MSEERGELKAEEHGEQDKSGHEHRKQSLTQRFKSLTIGNQIIATANVVIALTTTLYAVVSVLTFLIIYQSSGDTHTLAQATMRLADETQGSLEITRNGERAWLDATPALASPLKPNTANKVIGVIMNSGRTPAVNMTYRMAVEVLSDGHPPTLQYFKRPTTSVSVVFPQHPITTMPIAIGAFSKTQLESLAAGNGHLFVFGIIQYTDVFKSEHMTKFCYFYAGGIAFATCNQGYNEAN